jgi:hypothetical protein
MLRLRLISFVCGTDGNRSPLAAQPSPGTPANLPKSVTSQATPPTITINGDNIALS